MPVIRDSLSLLRRSLVTIVPKTLYMYMTRYFWQVSVPTLLEHLSHESLIQVFSSILLERRVILIASKLG